MLRPLLNCALISYHFYAMPPFKLYTDTMIHHSERHAPNYFEVLLLLSLGFRPFCSLEMSSDLSTVFNLQAAHRELVLCVLPLILSMRSLKRSIVGKPVQLYGSIHIPQSIYTGKHRRSWKHPLLYKDPL